MKSFYYNNIWFSGVPEIKRVDQKINFDWGTGLVTTSNADYISVFWKGAVRAPTTEVYTFTFETSDFVKVIWQGDVVGDTFTTGGDVSFQVSLIEDMFYDIEIHYKEEENAAKAKLFWESLSMTKEIVPEFYLYYYDNISASPFEIQVLQGNTVAAKSIAYDFQTNSQVGTPYSFKIESRDAIDLIVNNSSDNYQVYLTGPGATTDGDVYGSSYYDLGASDGTYRAQVTPIKPGTFKLYISLNGIEIKDSPFNVTVKIGKPSNVTSQLTGIAFPKNVLAGVSFEFTLELYDAFGNKLNAEPEIPIDIDSVALFQSSSYTSPIGVPDIANFDTVTGKDFGGAVASNDDGTYKITYTVFRAGTFNLTLNINGNPLTGLPGVLNIQPSEIEPDNCVIKTTPATSYVAGATLVFEYQCRDMYHNNVQVLAASFTSTSILIEDATDNSFQVGGVLVDIPAASGCFSLTFNPTSARTYKLDSSINSANLNSFSFSVTALNVANNVQSSVTLLSPKTSYTAGETITFRIVSKDQYGNVNLNDTTTVFVAELKGTSPVSTKSLTVNSIGNGIFQMSTTENILNSYVLEAKLGVTQIVNSPISAINFDTPANSSGKETYFSLFTNNLTAGVASSGYDLMSEDGFGNPTYTVSDQFKLIVHVNTEYKEFLSQASLGKHSFSVNLEKTGVFQAELVLKEKGGLYGLYYKDNDFTNLVDTTSYSLFTDVIRYTQVDNTIDIDTGYSPVLSNFPNSKYSIKWIGYITSSTTTVYSIIVEAFGKVKIFINNVQKLDYDSLDISKNTVSFSFSFSANEKYSIEVQYLNSTGNNKVKLFWQSASMPLKEIIPSSNLLRLVPSDDTPRNITVVPAKSASATISNPSCVLGISSSFVATLFDSLNNKQAHNLDFVSGTLSNGVASYPVVCVNAAVGEYTCSYTVLVAGSAYSLVLSLTPQGDSVAITQNFSTSFDCQFSTVDTTKTAVSGSGLTTAFAGQIQSFKVELFNSANIKKTTSGDKVSVTITSSSETVTYKQIDFLNGDYTVSYQAKDTANQFTITVVVNDDIANQQQFNFTLQPYLPSSSLSTYTNLVATYQLNTANSVSIDLKDAWNNPITSTQKLIGIFEKENKHWYKLTQSAPSSSVNNLNFNISDTCGNYTLSVFSLKSNFSQTYYSNYNLSGSPVKSSSLNSINIYYSSSDDIHEGVNKQFTSMIVQGYLEPAFSETYTIIVKSNAHIKIKFNAITQFDSTVSGKSILYSFNKSLSSTLFYEIYIEVFIDGTDLNLSLEWLSASQIQEFPNGLQKVEMNPINGVKSVKFDTTPTAPQNIRQGSLAQSSVTFLWDQPTSDGCNSLVKYKVYKDDGLGTFNFLADVVANITTYTDVDF